MKGLENWEKVCEIIFAFCKIMRSLSTAERERIFEEVKKIEDLHWNTMEETGAYNYCTELSLKMPKYPSGIILRNKCKPGRPARSGPDLECVCALGSTGM